MKIYKEYIRAAVKKGITSCWTINELDEGKRPSFTLTSLYHYPLKDVNGSSEFFCVYLSYIAWALSLFMPTGNWEYTTAEAEKFLTNALGNCNENL